LARPSSRAVPALPGATKTLDTRGDATSFHARACSRAPEPMTRSFIRKPRPVTRARPLAIGLFRLPASAFRLLESSLDDRHDLSLGHGILFLDQDLLHRSRVFGDHRDFHLHGLDDDKRVA